MRERFHALENLPPLSELQKKTVLMLLNRNNAVDIPKPMNPNVIPVGGLQLVEPKPLKEVNNVWLKFSLPLKFTLPGPQKIHRKWQERNSSDVTGNQYEKRSIGQTNFN